jgi:Arm DNA-binding domain
MSEDQARGRTWKRGKRWVAIIELGRDAEGNRRRIWRGGFATQREANR